MSGFREVIKDGKKVMEAYYGPEIINLPQGVITQAEIQDTCIKAIALPDCPVKKAHAIAQRIWLAKKINEYLERVKAEQNKTIKLWR